MSDVTITLTEEEARDALSFMIEKSLAEKIRAALPPEYPAGTVAWVSTKAFTLRQLSIFEDGKWRTTEGSAISFPAESITKVEPLRVLADDEIAVKRPLVTGDAMAGAAERLADLTGFIIIPEWLKYVAQRLYAEQK